MEAAPDDTVDGELIIPIKRWRVLSRSLYSVGVAAIFAVGLLSYVFRRGGDFGIAVAVGIAISSLFAIGAWMIARDDLRTIRARRLRLDNHGFSFGKHRWLWTDIENLYVSRGNDGEGGDILRIAVVYRPDSATTAPSRTPINPPDFSTGDRPLVDILRMWLQRHGAPASLSAEPAAAAEAPVLDSERTGRRRWRR